MVNTKRVFSAFLTVGLVRASSALYDQTNNRADYSPLGIFNTIYDAFSGMIKSKDTPDVCFLSASFDSNGEEVDGYSYFVNEFSNDCKMASDKDLVQEAVKKCANSLSSNGALVGCCKSVKGDGWAGELSLPLACLEMENLRLTHAIFANLSYINTFLFTRIQLQTTRASLKSLQGTDLSRVANFARILTFVTPPSWMLPRQTFENIVNDCSIKDQVDYTETQMDSKYVTYMEAAKDSQIILDEDSTIREVWVEALQIFGPGLHRICLWSKDCTHSDLPGQLPPHLHNHDVHEYACNYASAISGDRLFATVMSCLAASGIAVPDLEVTLDMTGRFQCTKIPGWDDLDLSALHALKIHLHVPEIFSWLQHMDIPGALPCLTFTTSGNRASNIIQSLVDKCHSTLSHLELSGEGAVGWPTQHLTYDLGALQAFDYWMDTVQPPLLADAITRMPGLTHFQIGCVKHLVREGCSYADWRHILDAIRDHPNVVGANPKGLSVSLRGLECGSRTQLLYEGVICRDNNIATERHGPRPEGKTRSGFLVDEGYALERHLYGEVAFEDNYGLRHAFDDWGSEVDSDSEEDDEPGDGLEQEGS
ncbi:hypothetical protein FHETE_8884 [Fusarium heterosporum]|uniref:Secreted protein CSS2 C-terminal domain-containing protein n=1 Tax=Fusarium heterosporum TaxID=42747 RepID=A0A8H5WJR6_FUSHE|nr:hypothetical protein FHETE_8884 [Fusarium heterosporum]